MMLTTVTRKRDRRQPLEPKKFQIFHGVRKGKADKFAVLIHVVRARGGF